MTILPNFTHNDRVWEAYTSGNILQINAKDFWRIRVTYSLKDRRITEYTFGPSCSGDPGVAAQKRAFAEALVQKALVSMVPA